MKNKKLLIGIIIGIAIAITTILTVVIINVVRDKKFQESEYLTKGEYYKLFVEEYNMSSQNYTGEEIKNATDYSVFASIMVEWEYITEKQAKNLNKPLTKEIVAQTIVRNTNYDNTYNVEIKDIKKCYDKQAIIDSVGMGIFELENGKFNPNNYITLEDVKNAFDKSMQITSTPSGEDAKVVWNDLKINIDGKDYSYPYNLSQFLENGWQVSSDSQEVINQTVAKASEYEMSEAEKQWYIENGYEIPENPTTLAGYEIYKGSSVISFIVDPTQSDVLVRNANVIRIFIENTNFNFYGVERGFTIKQVQDLFGTKNYELIEMDEDVHAEYHNYISYYNSNKSVQLILDDNTKLVNNITISIN